MPAPVVEVVAPAPADLISTDIDPAEEAEAARLEVERLDRTYDDEPLQPLAPRPRACTVNSAGECVYRATSKQPATYPYSDEELDELRAHDVYGRFGKNPDRVRDSRYMRLRILAEHRDLEDELAAIEAFIAEYDGHPLAAWAAFLLLDELTLRATESEETSVADLEAIVRWLERLPTMALWQLESAEDLRIASPTLSAGVQWRLGLAARERGDYAECADTFLAIANQFVDHDRHAALFVFAGDCLEADLRIDEAIDVRRQILERFPQSEYAKDTRWSLARLELATARYEDALDDFLVFAGGSPAKSRLVVPHAGPVFSVRPDPQRDEALIAAYPIAATLGRREAVDEIRELFGQRDPDQDPTVETAVAHWDMRPASGRPLQAFASRQLELFQDAWSVGALEAHVALGELAWSRACSGRIEDGLCVAKQRSSASKSCSLSGTATPRVRPRRTRDADPAMAEFQGVVDRGLGKQGVRDEDDARARAALATAEFHLLEPKLEAYLSAGPDAPDARATAKALSDAYAKFTVGVIAIHASARIARVWETLANAGLQRPAKGKACVPIDADAQQAIARARAGYEACLERAIEAQHFDEVARRCEAALVKIDPAAFPALHEIVPEPSVSSGPSIRSAGVQDCVAPECR